MSSVSSSGGSAGSCAPQLTKSPIVESATGLRSGVSEGGSNSGFSIDFPNSANSREKLYGTRDLVDDCGGRELDRGGAAEVLVLRDVPRRPRVFVREILEPLDVDFVTHRRRRLYS